MKTISICIVLMTVLSLCVISPVADADLIEAPKEVYSGETFTIHVISDPFVYEYVPVLLVKPGRMGKEPIIIATTKTDVLGRATLTSPEVKYKTKLMIIARTKHGGAKTEIYVLPARWTA